MLRNERAPTPPYDNTTTAYSILISLKKKLNWNHVIFFSFLQHTIRIEQSTVQWRRPLSNWKIKDDFGLQRHNYSTECTVYHLLSQLITGMMYF